MKGIKYIAISLMLTIIMGCPDTDKFDSDVTLIIVNNSNETIIEYRDYSMLSDTTLQVSNPYTSNEIIQSSQILPGETRRIPEESETISRFGVLHIYLLSRDTLEQVPWERIRNENLVLTRYDLTLEDLELINWKIEYP